MKKYNFFLTAIIFVFIVAFMSCNTPSGDDTTETPNQESVETDSVEADETMVSEESIEESEQITESFACPMHPEEMGSESDTCPKCGMPLKSLDSE